RDRSPWRPGTAIPASSPGPGTCSSCRGVGRVWKGPVALEAELALMLKVLGTTADSSLGDILDQPLCKLCHVHLGLQVCKSLGCLKTSVRFNLFCLLSWDLKCVTSGDLCV
ncbi:hypothetical protein MC885_000034, partial [Smutsia gigantea]